MAQFILLDTQLSIPIFRIACGPSEYLLGTASISTSLSSTPSQSMTTSLCGKFLCQCFPIRTSIHYTLNIDFFCTYICIHDSIGDHYNFLFFISHEFPHVGLNKPDKYFFLNDNKKRATKLLCSVLKALVIDWLIWTHPPTSMLHKKWKCLQPLKHPPWVTLDAVSMHKLLLLTDNCTAVNHFMLPACYHSSSCLSISVSPYPLTFPKFLSSLERLRQLWSFPHGWWKMPFSI